MEKNIKRFVEKWHVNPRTLNADAKRGFNYFYSKNYEKAIEYFGKTLEKAPKNIGLLHAKGFILKHYLKKFKEAENCFLNLLKLKPVDEFDWYNRGSAFMLLNENNEREALKCFNEAIKINPEYIDAWFDKGYIHYWLGQFEESMRCLNKMIELDSKNESAWANKGIIFSAGSPLKASGGKKFRGWKISGSAEFIEAYNKKCPQPREGIECYDKVLEINPKNTVALLKKGEILEDYFGKPKEAIKCYDEILRIDPKNIEALSLKASALKDILDKHRDNIWFDSNGKQFFFKKKPIKRSKNK